MSVSSSKLIRAETYRAILVHLQKKSEKRETLKKKDTFIENRRCI